VDRAPQRDPSEITVITTHLNADFDALASLLAAQKLYPDARVVFPGSQEKNLRNFFIDSMVYLFNMAEVSTIDLDRVKRLVLVDTRQPGRIGRLADLIKKPGVDIHVYDHHPPGDGDIRGRLEVCAPTGANVTLLIEAIRARGGIEISPDEATIMCLGLYEDTGSFTFPSTTERDFLAAAFLLARGANLNVVSELIARELNPEQVTLLNDMIQSANRSQVNGVEVVMTSISRETYIPDFAFLVQKMARMENLEAIFALALMESKIYIVARSRLEEVDVGAILATLGGGGHAYAAAATVKGQTLAQTEHHLLQILFEKVRARRLARHLMSAPAIGADAEVSCEEANNLLTRYNVNALLVTAQRDGPLSQTRWGAGARVHDHRGGHRGPGCGPGGDPEEDHRHQAAHPAGGGGWAHHRRHHPHGPAEYPRGPAAGRTRGGGGGAAGVFQPPHPQRHQVHAGTALSPHPRHPERDRRNG
jgi:tRNA nucleotidyltransferase (CCA-adding enzyme)